MNPGRLAITKVFFGATVILVASIALTYLIGLVAINSNHSIVEARSVLQDLEQITSAMRDAETAQLGYLLTGEERAYSTYRRALHEVSRVQAGLRGLVATGDLPGPAVDKVLRLSQEKITELDQGVQVRHDSALEPALALVRDSEGKGTMVKFRAQVALLVSSKQLQLDQALGRASVADFWRNTVFILTIAFNLGFLAWAYARVLREVNLREAAVQEARTQKELLATTLSSIGDGVIAADAQGRLTFLNPEAERLTGWSNEDATGRQLGTVFQVRDQRNGKPAENPAEKVLRLGARVDLSDQLLLVNKKGNAVPIGDSAAPILQPTGDLAGVVVVFRDISELVAARETLSRGKAELEELVEARTAKLREMVSELQHISYSLTHDMRAPLRAMAAFAQMLMEDSTKPGPSSQSKEYCRRILAAAGRMDTLIRDALSFTRAVLQDLPLRPVNLSVLLRGIIETYPNLQPDLADIQIEGTLPVILGNESLLTQCFSNLLENAVKFVAADVRPCVRIWAQPNGTVARIWVQDNGIGIPDHAQPRLFGMFQKLDNQYEGTGIGLAIVRKVAQRMGGNVGVESQPGHGSRFWVELRTASNN
jgi:PAS domain S-box-containing protein